MIIPEVEGRRTEEIARPERRGISTRTVIEEAKAKVSTLDLADLLCGPGEPHRVGDGKRAASCPLPGHEDKTPSFVVYTSTNSWFCFACLVGGDVVELARHAWGYSKDEVATAAAMLLMEFGHEVPQMPPAWFRKQERQKPINDAIEETVKGNFRRRVFKYIVLPYLQLSDSPAEEKVEIAAAWEDFQASMRRIGR